MTFDRFLPYRVIILLSLFVIGEHVLFSMIFISHLLMKYDFSRLFALITWCLLLACWALSLASRGYGDGIRCNPYCGPLAYWPLEWDSGMDGQGDGVRLLPLLLWLPCCTPCLSNLKTPKTLSQMINHNSA